MEEEEETATKPNTLNNENSEKKSRKICSGCNRPSTVCICKELPPSPIQTKTQLIILQHPHELRHKLATAPILPKCLLNSQTIISRRLRLGSSPLLDSLFHQQNHPQTLTLFLFPGLLPSSPPPIPLQNWVSSNPNPTNQTSNSVVLIVFDGTWKHAKEMVSASLPFLSKFAIRVCLNFDEGFDGGSIWDSDLVLRKEPFLGCVSTIEAVARSLRLLEVGSRGEEIEERLLSVLRAMVRFQACYLKPVKPRPKLVSGKCKNSVDNKNIC
ncbi:DTW domain-containing protein [Tasmannia lanceolata]|uniref:DTW domain-containing protein n=1 Tax=Tasmannia lanceolata TaxID=3420 RepID=UPI00406368FF